jgi:hypothetical protein
MDRKTTGVNERCPVIVSSLVYECLQSRIELCQCGNRRLRFVEKDPSSAETDESFGGIWTAAREAV